MNATTDHCGRVLLFDQRSPSSRKKRWNFAGPVGGNSNWRGPVWMPVNGLYPEDFFFKGEGTASWVFLTFCLAVPSPTPFGG